MIKMVIFICLVYLAYRLFVGPPLLNEWKTGKLKQQEPDEDDCAEYEEVD